MSSLKMLKLKRKVLAAESKMVRKEELIARNSMRFLSTMTMEKTNKRIAKMGLTHSQLKRVEKNREKSKNSTVYHQAEAFEYFHRLRDMRVNVIRKLSRVSHLANAYIREIPYEIVENNSPLLMSARTHNKLRKALVEEINSFDYDCDEDDIKTWLNGKPEELQSSVVA